MVGCSIPMYISFRCLKNVIAFQCRWDSSCILTRKQKRSSEKIPAAILFTSLTYKLFFFFTFCFYFFPGYLLLGSRHTWPRVSKWTRDKCTGRYLPRRSIYFPFICVFELKFGCENKELKFGSGSLPQACDDVVWVIRLFFYFIFKVIRNFIHSKYA